MLLRMSSYILVVEPVYELRSGIVAQYRIRILSSENRAVVFEGTAGSITEAEAIGEEQLLRIIGGGPAPARSAA